MYGLGFFLMLVGGLFDLELVLGKIQLGFFWMLVRGKEFSAAGCWII